MFKVTQLNYKANIDTSLTSKKMKCLPRIAIIKLTVFVAR